MNKLKLYAYACRHKHFEFDNDPITKLITNIKEVITIYKNYPNESKKFFYFSAKKFINYFMTKIMYMMLIKKIYIKKIMK